MRCGGLEGGDRVGGGWRRARGASRARHGVGAEQAASARVSGSRACARHRARCFARRRRARTSRALRVLHQVVADLGRLLDERVARQHVAEGETHGADDERRGGAKRASERRRRTACARTDGYGAEEAPCRLATASTARASLVRTEARGDEPRRRVASTTRAECSEARKRAAREEESVKRAARERESSEGAELTRFSRNRRPVSDRQNTRVWWAISPPALKENPPSTLPLYLDFRSKRSC